MLAKRCRLLPGTRPFNVQGDRTVGIWEAPTEAFLDRMETGLGFELPRTMDTMWFTPLKPCNKESGCFLLHGG